MTEKAVAADVISRVLAALVSLKAGNGVLVVDDKYRENEADLVYPAELMTVEQMALTIRHGSGIVCLCLEESRCQKLNLPLMVDNNTSTYGTGFTVTIEAADGVTTGVSAADRITTIRAAIADNATPKHLNRPGHVFPLRAHPGGVMARNGHTEASIALMALAGLKSAAVICELTNEDGSMAKAQEIHAFSAEHKIPIVGIDDIITCIKNKKYFTDLIASTWIDVPSANDRKGT